MPIKRINTRWELQELARELKTRSDWHEPDEQELTAAVKGESFDNAGFWGSSWLQDRHSLVHGPGEEMFVQIRKDGQTVAEVNLATLFAFACGWEG